MNNTAIVNNQETDRFSEYKKTGSEQIRDEILEEYKYIPKLIAGKYSAKGLEYDDLYQCAFIGLIGALNNFNPDKGVKFSTYATSCVLGEVKHYCREKGNYIKVPRRFYEIFYKAKKLNEKSLAESGRTLSDDELISELNVSKEELDCAMLCGNNKIAKSLDEFMNEGENLVFSDLLGIEDSSLILAEDRTFISECLGRLTEEERAFLKYRYYDELSQTDIARITGVSQMKISRMEKKVLSVLKKMYFEV